MTNTKLIKIGNKYFVKDLYGESTGTHEDPMAVIDEWEYFEKLNTNREPHRRFLSHITPIEEIDEIVNKLKNDIQRT